MAASETRMMRNRCFVSDVSADNERSVTMNGNTRFPTAKICDVGYRVTPALPT